MGIIGFSGAARSKDRVLGHFAWDGQRITVRTRLRPDGSIVDGVDFFDSQGHLIYGTIQQVGTVADALAAFAAWQEGLEPGPVYPGDDNGESNDLQREIDAMQATDPMAKIGLYGLGAHHQGIHGQ